MFRFADPRKLKISSECFEVSADYIGESVSGVEFRSFILVTSGSCEGFEVECESGDFGIVVEVDADEEVAIALESLIPEIVNRVKGLSLDFRKESVRLKVAEELLKPNFRSCLAKLIHDALESIGLRNCVRIVDYNLVNFARKIHEERLFKLDDDEVETFYVCKSCQFSLHNHACVISPQRPSCCGTSYAEAKAAHELGIVEYYSPIRVGEKLDVDEYSGVNEFMRQLGFERVRLHSVIDSPLPAGLYSEVIIFYIPEEDGFGVVDREYRKKTPIGLSFSEMEKLVLGRQTSGFVGECLGYLKSRRFLTAEGGWKRVRWMSPNILKLLGNQSDSWSGGESVFKRFG
ncbi:MAG: hypothetical protein ABWW66_01350 [Archaeoglobaceae archaeon]